METNASINRAKVIMVQGTSSNVGKSVLVAALCRIFKQDGYRVAPFKSQNMALNAFVTPEGGEIGRAQAMQAEASGIAPSIHMNPVLLKPEANSRSQIVLHGKVYQTTSAKDYYQHTSFLLEKVEESLNYLRQKYDIVVIEGAGSPAEINLKPREIANMRIAKLAEAPVLLCGDIDRGGVYAFLVGTLELLDEDERKLVKGFIINKFRGDVSLIKDANDFLEKRTGLPVLGVVPYYRDILLAQEDSVYLDERRNRQSNADLEIAVIRSPRISNYDDFDPLEEDGANLRYISRPEELGDPDLIIIPGSKTTVPDLLAITQSGVAGAVVRKARAGTPVFGACGGYQMLGRLIHDPDHVESDRDTVEGLGLMEAETTFAREKATTQVKGVITEDRGLLAGLKGEAIYGYEIHMGRTESCHRPFQITQTQKGPADYADGSINESGTVIGSYIHGIFQSHGFRRGLLNNLRRRKGIPERTYDAPLDKEKHYDALADLVRNSLDIRAVYRILEQGAGS
ncbi:cobyric acid synthase [Dehalogenimonas sp. 4OHTPN]|uniref:Cobyric acid synthase n=1 Tax=Dehalogenimonas sp. 4OHTPN TaxID=3166643 RepID=A0AAU8G8C0_9CHLR